VTLEGTAAHVTDAQTLDRVAALYRQLGWPADVDAGACVSRSAATIRLLNRMVPVPRRQTEVDGRRPVLLPVSRWLRARPILRSSG